MADKHRFLLRVDPQLYAVLQQWAADELRSVNGQIELLLREQARKAGRWPPPSSSSRGSDGSPTADE